jgi:membrane protein YqaA with SNARE-associated domain
VFSVVKVCDRTRLLHFKTPYFSERYYLKSFLLKLKLGFAKYKAFLLAMLGPLGIWAPFAISTCDAAALGIPVDPIIIGYVWASRDNLGLVAFYCISSAIGSALGSLVPYWIGRAGGELLLLKRIDHRRLEQLRDKFESQEFFFIMIPCFLPPGTPFKLFVLCAGVFEMRVPLFMLAIFSGRLLRCGIVAFLTIRFGEDVRTALKDHLAAVGVMAAVAVVLYFLVRYFRGRKSNVVQA